MTANRLTLVAIVVKFQNTGSEKDPIKLVIRERKKKMNSYQESIVIMNYTFQQQQHGT